VRRRLVGIAAPTAFLLAATVAVLLVRADLRADEDERPPATTTAQTATGAMELRLVRRLRVP
jgi:hypothetical protein